MPNQPHPEPASAAQYDRCMVFSGGGFRFAYYLGMYSAAVDTGNRPDLLLATCGGAIAGAIIHALPDDASRKQWVASPAMHQFLLGLASTPKAAIGRALVQALRRRFSRAAVGRVPDLFEDYFFDIPARLPLPPAAALPPADGVMADQRPALAIIGAKMLFTPQDVGQPRGGRKLYAETVFGNARCAALLQGMQAPLSAPQWGDNAVAAPLVTETGMALADAVRISISDMFYFRCFSTPDDQHYMGGVIDLFPIEVAQRLAHQVVMEMKSPFHPGLAIPALRAVLGFDGNQRLRHVHGQAAAAWIDTSDVEQVLARGGMRKRLAWRENRIRLAMPASLAAYQVHVDALWQYGYQRGIEAFTHPQANFKQHMRYANKLNRSMP